MFRTSSWNQRGGISVILLTALCAGFVTLPHSEGGDDSACVPVFVSHDQAAHYIGAAPSTGKGEGQHCYLCHAARSFFSVFQEYDQRDGALRAERLHLAAAARGGRVAWSLLPGRAPPV
jgi:hypothetical protein